MPFGSYQGSLGSAVLNVCKVVKRTGCDCVKVEVSDSHAGLIRSLADAGVAVMAHLGLRPQSVGLLGGYKFQGRTAFDAQSIISTARVMQSAGMPPCCSRQCRRRLARRSWPRSKSR